MIHPQSISPSHQGQNHVLDLMVTLSLVFFDENSVSHRSGIVQCLYLHFMHLERNKMILFPVRIRTSCFTYLNGYFLHSSVLHIKSFHGCFLISDVHQVADTPCFSSSLFNFPEGHLSEKFLRWWKNNFPSNFANILGNFI